MKARARILHVKAVAALLALGLFASPALAKSKSQPILTGNPIADISRAVEKQAAAPITSPTEMIAKIVAWAASDGVADLDIAIKLSTAANDTVTLQCWTDLRAFAAQVQTLPKPEDLPKVHLATDVEVITELLVQLQPNAKTVVDCQGLANFYKVTAVNLVTGVVTGALALGGLGVPGL